MKTRRRYNIDLSAHMAECEANYLRLMKLMPELAETDRRLFNVFQGDRSTLVQFLVTSRSPYTTELKITQIADLPSLPAHLKAHAGLELTVRMYHDAKSAEVIEVFKERRFDPVYDYPNAKMRQRDEKAQINRFLSEFLSLCLAHGVANEEPIAVTTN